MLNPIILNLLHSRDYDGLIELSRKDRSVLRHLISLTNGKNDLARSATEAIGKITSSMPPYEARKIIQRILWMMRDESGGSCWGGPEILGEIVRGACEPFMDIIPVIASFHEEDFFRAGVLRALGRLAEVRTDLIMPYAEIIKGYAGDPDPEVRGNAIYALKALG